MKRVIWAAAATGDLKAARTYLEQYGDDVAQAAIDRLVLATDWLLERPLAGPAFGDGAWRKWKPRRSRYLLIYRLVDDAIEIGRVRHEREDWR